MTISRETLEQFKAIFLAAKMLNETGLLTLINDGISIGIHQGSETPLSRLAKKGHHDAVFFLIDRFGANIYEAVRGYAEGGYFHIVNYLLEQFKIHPKYAMEGYASQGLEHAITQLRHHYRHAPQIIKDLERAELHGYVLGQYTHKIPKGNNSFLVFSYALTGDVEAVTHLCAQHPFDDLLRLAVEGYAMGGHHEELIPILDHYPELRPAACKGYARGGNLSAVKSIRNSYPNSLYKNLAAEGHALEGDFRSVTKLLEEGAEISYALSGFIKSGFLVTNQSRKRLMAFITSSAIRKDIESKNVSCEYPLVVGQRISQLMEKTSLGYEQAIRVNSLISLYKCSLDTALEHYFNDPLPTGLNYAQRAAVSMLMQQCNLSEKQALAWTLADIRHQLWFLSGPNNKALPTLPHEIFFKIAVDTFEPSLTEAECRDLYQKMGLLVNKKPLLNALKKYTEGFFDCNRHQRRARSFIDACVHAQSMDELVELLKYQKDLFSGQCWILNDSSKKKHERPLKSQVLGPYHDIINQYHDSLKNKLF